MNKHGLKRTATFTLSGDGFSIHTFELSCQCSRFTWNYMKDKLYKEQEKRKEGKPAWIYKDGHGKHICTRYSKHGVRITLEHNKCKNEHETFFVRMVINPRKLLDPDSSYLGILEARGNTVKQIQKAFRELFEETAFDADMDVYKLRRVDVCTNVHCDNAKIFRELIRASQRLPTPPKFKRKYSDNPDSAKAKRYDKHYIRFMCGHYELVLYDKTYQMTENGLALSYEKLPEGVLRYEVHIQRDLIRRWEKKLPKETSTEILKWVIHNSQDILIESFETHFPPAYYLRLPELQEFITSVSCQDFTRRKMRGFVNSIQELASVDKALEQLPWKQSAKKELIERFYKNNVSPISLRKNFCAERLPNPTLLLLMLAQKEEVEVAYMRSK